MDPVLIAPGLTLTDVLYETAASGVATYASDLAPLTWEQFTTPTSWWLVPDGSGRLSKTELTLTEGRDRTVKINVWHAPDIREADGPLPHSHPWPFSSKILLGGYSEDRYVLVDGQVRAEIGREHTQGTANTVGRDLYHEVTGLHTAPGATVTLMLCGRGERGAWGHLDPATGTVAPPGRDPRFPEHLRALN
ncbi:hypothetical protein ACWGJ2_40215, partial [Streptomyces sp. NPDC054796]